MVEPSIPVDIDEVDETKYELEFLRCEVEPLEDTEAAFNFHDTNRLDPGESSVEQVRLRMIDRETPPFICSAEVWDSLLDTAFPDD